MSAKKGHIQKCRQKCFHNDQFCKGEINSYIVRTFSKENSEWSYHLCEVHKNFADFQRQKPPYADALKSIILSPAFYQISKH